MKGYSKILVPLDFSELSEETLQTALRVMAEDGEAILLHVVEWMPVVTEIAFGVYAHRKDIQQLIGLSEEKLAEYVEAHPGRRLTTHVREGKASVAILDAAREFEPDLIVIGSHGRGGLDHLLIGSVAERVLRKATLPVLIVRRPAQDG